MAMINEIEVNGQNIGYRSMWQRLNFVYGLHVTQNRTRQMLRIIDPEGVARRTANRLLRRVYRCPGPNHMIHIDGYDKLKPYGIAIHGAVDGFSRKILWLKAGYSNSNPRLIAKFYLDFIRHINGVPKIIRADRGTENVLVHRMHVALRWFHRDGYARENSFQYGRSTSNQRIEGWWSQLRRISTNSWINIFKDLRDRGLFDNSDPVQVECLRFCFLPLIQKQLDSITIQWNQHRIRPQRHGECPSGKPDLMYHIPEAYRATDCKMSLDYPERELLEVEREYCSDFPRYGCHEGFVNVVEELVGDIDQYEMPNSLMEALRLYTCLMDLLQ